MPSNRLCFAASASRRLCSNAAGIDRGSGEDGAETESESSPARVRTSAASGEAGTSSRGEGGFDRLLTFSSGLPLPDPLASPLARARSSPSSFPRVALGCASLVGLCPAEGPGPESRGPGGRFSASRSGVSSRTSHPEPGVPSGGSIAAPRPPQVSSAAHLPPVRALHCARVRFGPANVKSGVFLRGKQAGEAAHRGQNLFDSRTIFRFVRARPDGRHPL
jgi:hypothetical protein